MKKVIAMLLSAAFIFAGAGSALASEAEEYCLTEDSIAEYSADESSDVKEESVAADFSEPETVLNFEADSETVQEDAETQVSDVEDAAEDLTDETVSVSEEETAVIPEETESEETAAEEEAAAEETETIAAYNASDGDILAEGTYGNISWNIVLDGESAVMTLSGNGAIMTGFLGALCEEDEMIAYNRTVKKDITEVIINEGITEIGGYFFLFGQYSTTLQKISIPESVKKIDASAFGVNSGLTSVYYAGNRSEWEQIDIGEDNDYLINAEITFGKADDQKQNGWVYKDGVWMFYDDGQAVTGWVYAGGNWYYMNSDGIMQTGWQYINNAWYHLSAGGKMATGWLKVGENWYYFNGSGAMATGWLKVGENWYYFNGSGTMATGWLKVGENWYYFNGSGTMTTGWLKVGENWYYFNGSGAMATGWQYINDAWYYLSESGKMQTGWQNINDAWYYLSESGKMQTGWQYIKDKWYYLSEGGKMQTGWQYINDKWYYFYDWGNMLSGSGLIKINDKWYFFENDVYVKNCESSLDSDLVDFLAGIYNKATTIDMTDSEKLWAVFKYVGNRDNFAYMLTRIPYYRGYDWPEVYATDMMNDGGSVCHGYSALFGYLASMIGYKGYFCCNGYHAWVEIGGLVYDPVFMDSAEHNYTIVYGDTYSYASSLGLGAGYNYWDATYGTYEYEDIPEF